MLVTKNTKDNEHFISINSVDVIRTETEEVADDLFIKLGAATAGPLGEEDVIHPDIVIPNHGFLFQTTVMGNFQLDIVRMDPPDREHCYYRTYLEGIPIVPLRTLEDVKNFQRSLSRALGQ